MARTQESSDRFSHISRQISFDSPSNQLIRNARHNTETAGKAAIDFCRRLILDSAWELAKSEASESMPSEVEHEHDIISAPAICCRKERANKQIKSRNNRDSCESASI